MTEVFLLHMGTTELEMTEQKTTGQISASSQSSIAARKDVLACGRLTSSPPLPPPLHALAHYRPPLYPIPIPIGAVCGWSQRVWGGGGKRAELVNLPFPMKFRRTLRAKADCTHIVFPWKAFPFCHFLILWWVHIVAEWIQSFFVCWSRQKCCWCDPF